MDSLLHSSSVSGADIRESADDPLVIPRPQRKVARECRKLPTAIEARISSLKVLSLTLLAQVESLEKQVLGDLAEELDLQAEVRRFEIQLIKNALVITGGRQRRAARLLGLKVTTLNTKIKRYKLVVHDPSLLRGKMGWNASSATVVKVRSRTAISATKNT